MGALGRFDEYINTVYQVAPIFKLDPSIIVAQASEETGKFRSDYWTKEGNPAGIGIWKSGVPSPFSIMRFTDWGRIAALIHVAELYVRLNRVHPNTLPAPLNEIKDIDGDHLGKVWNLVGPGGKYPLVETIDDLNLEFFDASGGYQCTWACDPQYQDLVVEHGNLLYPNLPDYMAHDDGGEPVGKLTFGKVPHPVYDRRIITSRNEGDGWNFVDRANNSILGVVYHRMVGSLWGTDDWFRRPGNGLTHYGIGVGSVDGADNDGRIMMWLDPKSNVSPWASGPWQHGGPDGEAFVNKYGVGAINGRLLAIENSGQYNTPMSEKMIEANAAISAYWADQIKIPWDKYPINPANGLTFTYAHDDFQNEKPCPGPVVYANLQKIIDRTKAILRHYQDDGIPNEDKPGAFPKWTGLDVVVDGTVWHPIKRVIKVAKGGARMLAFAGDDAPEVSPRRPEGYKLNSIYKVKSKGGKWYWVTASGYRVLDDEIKEKVTFDE